MHKRTIAWQAVVTLLAAGFCGFAAAQTPAEVAATEYEEVMSLLPDVDRGRNVYVVCAVCHLPEGWGTPEGVYPQIAGQLRTVIIKQLADIRAGNRDNPMMYPFAVPRILGSAQDIADVAAYVAQLPMTSQNGLGPGLDLAHGEELYAHHCAKCHGDEGEGNVDDHIPAIAGQHYNYLKRQFDLIRTGRRKNADPKMVEQIESFSQRDEVAVLDYTSRLRPPPEKVAEVGWTNPDFPAFVRQPLPAQPPLAPPVPSRPRGSSE